MNISEKLKTIRKEKKISQKKLAELSGVGIATIQRIEYGELNPKRNTLQKIADALGVPETELDNDLKEKFEEWDKNTKRLSDSDYELIQKYHRLDDYEKNKVNTYVDDLLLISGIEVM